MLTNNLGLLTAFEDETDDWGGWSNAESAGQNLLAQASNEKARPPLQRAWLVPPGVGKTAAVIDELAARFAAGVVWEDRVYFFVPDHTVALEIVERLRAKLPAEATVWHRRGRLDEAGGETLCHKSMHDLVREAEELRADVQKGVCASCKRFATCPYQAQREAGPGVVVLPHAFATKAHVANARLVIVDEDLVMGLAKSAELSRSYFTAPVPDDVPEEEDDPEWQQGGTKWDAAYKALTAARKALSDATENFTRNTDIIGLRRAGLDLTLAKAAHAVERRRKVKLKAAMTKAFEKSKNVAVVREATQTARARFGEAWKGEMLFHTLIEQIALGDSTRVNLNAVTVYNKEREGGAVEPFIRFGWRSNVRFADKDVIILDASGEERLLRLVFPYLAGVTQMEVAAPHMRVIQVNRRRDEKRGEYSNYVAGKARLATGDNDNEEEQAEKAKARRKLVEMAEVLSAGRPIGLLTYKQVEESDQVANAPEHILPGHFGLLRGQNKWEDVPALMIVGRVMPTAENVAFDAGALFYDQEESVPVGGGIGRREEAYRMRDGAELIGVERHQNPVVDMVLRHITDAEAIQAVGRGRGVRRTADNPLTVYILGSRPVPGVVVDELRTLGDLMPNKLQLNFARVGVWLDNYRHFVAAFPGVFETESAAKKALSPERRGTRSYYNSFKGNVPLLSASYQLAGAGQKPAKAWFDPRRFDPARLSDMRDWIAQHVREIVKFKLE